MNIPKDLIILLGAVLLMGVVPAATLSVGSAPEQRTSDVIRRSDPVAASQGDDFAALHRRGVLSDTLRHEIRRGDVLIIDLPEDLDGRAVDAYSLLRAPALSWLVDYSFMWRTMPQDTGRHDVLIVADGRADTLIVTVVVE